MGVLFYFIIWTLFPIHYFGGAGSAWAAGVRSLNNTASSASVSVSAGSRTIQTQASTSNPRSRYYTTSNILSTVTTVTLPSGHEIQLDYDQLPENPVIAKGISLVDENTPGTMNIVQDEDSAVIKWDTFNIGKDAHVNFDQKSNSDWRVLNKINDLNPSLIFGKLTADGQVYLINHNGVLFGEGSQVNVHSMVAASLNNISQQVLDDIAAQGTSATGYDDFLMEDMSFKSYDDDGNAYTPGVVSNYGDITTGYTGSVFLIGSEVENTGNIVTPFGQVGLVAGAKASLQVDLKGGKVGRYTVDVEKIDQRLNNEATNFDTGTLIADGGLAGMYGNVVNQEGLVRSVTAIEADGKIELKAVDKIYTGVDSRTVCPVSDDGQRLDLGYLFSGGTIDLSGLDTILIQTDGTETASSGVRLIEHNGEMTAKSGTITLDAENRVYLGENSLIDVSGTWVTRDMADNQVSVQFNSDVLKDEHLQKGGILQGADIYVDPHEGSNIGDISANLAEEQKSALERSTQGGEIFIRASNGDIIQRKGGALDFSGGGTTYRDGYLKVTQLRSGRNIYAISEAPNYLKYDEIRTVDKRIQGFQEGDDAGALTLASRGIVLDGTLDGSVTRGIYQTETGIPVDALGNQTRRGVTIPSAGTLSLGWLVLSGTGGADYLLDDISLTKRFSELPDIFGPEDNLKDFSQYVSSFSDAYGRLYKTTLSTEKLNQAGLGEIIIRSNTQLSVDSDVDLELQPGGRFSAIARRIEHSGKISVPAGTIDLNVTDQIITSGDKIITLNDPSRWVADLDGLERLYLDNNSVLSVSGERVNNFGERNVINENVLMNGGNITLSDTTGEKTHGEVIIRKNALVDAGGGYQVNTFSTANGIPSKKRTLLLSDGATTGGDGGSITVQGDTVILETDADDPNLLALAFYGYEGGSVSIHTTEMTLIDGDDLGAYEDRIYLPENFDVLDAIPTAMKGHLIIPDNLFENTGFSSITLKAHNDLTVMPNVVLTPSKKRLAHPVSRAGQQGTLVDSLLQDMGYTAIQLNSGFDLLDNSDNDVDAGVLIGANALIQVAPEGTIQVQGTEVSVEGHLEALSGEVELTAEKGSLFLGSQSGIDVSGYVKSADQPLIRGHAVPSTPLDGGRIYMAAGLGTGTVTPPADAGQVTIEKGSVMDISGAQAVSDVKYENGMIQLADLGSNCGIIEIEGVSDMSLQGSVLASVKSGYLGGSLSASHKDESGTPLSISSSMLQNLSDQLTLQSWNQVRFDSFENINDLNRFRTIIIDTPEIAALGAGRTSLSADYIQLLNTFDNYNHASQMGLVMTGAELVMNAQFMEIAGDIRISDFEKVSLATARDLLLSDHDYQTSTGTKWAGKLETAADLKLTASRIYPTTRSDFSIVSSDTITTQMPDNFIYSRPIASAGGALTLSAPEIVHEGYIAAPMGNIKLDGDRIFIRDNSIISTRGETQVAYGTVEDVYWDIAEKSAVPTLSTVYTNVEEAPQKSVEINGLEVYVASGAVIDQRGGGSVFSYEFLPGLDGTINPLTNGFIIMPDQSVILPGKAIYLSGVEGISEGIYSILPEAYAFLPGAVVVYETNTTLLPGQTMTSQQGYTVVSGYETQTFMADSPGVYQGYVVRQAKDVLKEGTFNVQSYIAGNSGDLDIQTGTGILQGTLLNAPLSEYSGGTLSVSAEDMTITAASPSVPTNFGPNDVLPASLMGRMLVHSDMLQPVGYTQLMIGDKDAASNATKIITVEADTDVAAPVITFSASDDIVIDDNDTITGTSAYGTVSLLTNDGDISIGTNALVDAPYELNLAALNFTQNGSLNVSNRLNITSDRFFVVPDNYSGNLSNYGDGFQLNPSLWKMFKDVNAVSLTGSGGMTFLGKADLSAGQFLKLDTSGMGLDSSANDIVTISAPFIHILNSNNSSYVYGGSGTGDLAMTATNTMWIGNGDVTLNGFASVDMDSTNDLVFLGNGSLVSSGNLNLTSARTTAGTYQDSNGAYEVADFLVDAGSNNMMINRNANTSPSTAGIGGNLIFSAQQIEHAGLVELAGGRLAFEAIDDVTVRDGAEIAAYGDIYTYDIAGTEEKEIVWAGGVTFSSESGGVIIESGATVDVSQRAEQGDMSTAEIQEIQNTGVLDAGYVWIDSAQKDAVISGNLKGDAAFGKGGSFYLDTLGIGDPSTLLASLNQSGFNNTIQLRARTGDLDIHGNISANHLKVSADTGRMDLYNIIDTSGTVDGGKLELYALNDIQLHSGSLVRAIGSSGDGGDVTLGTRNGRIVFDQNARIDVTGGSTGGMVYFRSPRSDEDNDGQDDNVAMDLNGTVVGASRIGVEGFRVYDVTDGTINSEISGWQTDSNAYVAAIGNVQDNLVYNPDAQFKYLPGLEIQSANNLNLGQDWDLTNWIADGTDIALALKAGNNLTLNANILDHPNSYLNYADFTGLNGTRDWDSSSISLVAGADFSSADPSAVITGQGDLEILNGKLVYTESASISFASGNNATIAAGNTNSYMSFSPMKFSMGTYNGDINGYIGADLNLNGGVIQSAVGDISIKILGNLNQNLMTGSAIRTLGEIPFNPSLWINEYWHAENGGKIEIDVAGEVGATNDNLNSVAWDNAIEITDFLTNTKSTFWSANYDTSPTAGIATMGGGDILIRTGKDFLSQAGAFAEGNVTVLANGEMNGHFLVHGTDADNKNLMFLRAMGEFGMKPNLINQSIEMCYADVDLAVRGSIDLGTVYNPTFARDGLNEQTSNKMQWNLTYSPTSRLSLTSYRGAFHFAGAVATDPGTQSKRDRYKLLPASVDITAAQDILIDNSIGMAPGETGNLSLVSGGNILGGIVDIGTSGQIIRPQIHQSDLSPLLVYGNHDNSSLRTNMLITISMQSPDLHALTPVHVKDSRSNEIVAEGDIQGLNISMAKKTSIQAANDISELYYVGQNVNKDDISIIQAGGKISLLAETRHTNTTLNSGFVQGGTGLFAVMAGDSIDLGQTNGIQMVGDLINLNLELNDTDNPGGLYVMAGYEPPENLSIASLTSFFDNLRQASVDFNDLLASGDKDAAYALVDQARTNIFKPFLTDSQEGTGEIRMTSSQISTKTAFTDIYMMGLGNVDVGRTTFSDTSQSDDTGIYTTRESQINIYCEQDLNVNESRVMTFGGGDITVWSDYGNINAGRGSKTAISFDPPVIIEIDNNDGTFSYRLIFQPPAVGKGIRCTSYDPDGISGPEEEMEAGNIYVSAPEGDIDAGEAGIVGSNVSIGAQRVLNAENISFSGVGVGVPTGSDSSVGLAGLGGAGAMEGANATDSTAITGSAEDRFAKYVENLSETLMPKWLEVKVVDYIDQKSDSSNRNEDNEEEDEDEDAKEN